MKNIKLSLLIIFSSVFVIANSSVSIVLPQDSSSMTEFITMTDDYPVNYFRPFLTVEPYVGYGFIFGEIKNNDAELIAGESYNVDFGFKWRYQKTKRFGVIINTDFAYNHYEIKDGIKNDIFNFQVDMDPAYVLNREFYRTWSFGLGLGGRMKLGHVENNSSKKAGKYIELLAYGNYNYSRYYDLGFYSTSNLETDLLYKDSSLFSPFDAGLQMALGWNMFSVWGRYRLTDCFNSDYSKAKLPSFSVGLAINFFGNGF